MGSLSLRKLWAEAPWAPGHRSTVDVWTTVSDASLASSTPVGLGDLHAAPAPTFGKHDAHTTELVADKGPLLAPLAMGLRQSSRAFREEPGGERHRVFPFTLRTVLTSFRWPAGYSTAFWWSGTAPELPEGSYTDREVQGLALRGGSFFLTTTEAVWFVNREVVESDESEGTHVFPAAGPLPPLDEEVAAFFGAEPPRAQVTLHRRPKAVYMGRKYAVQGRPVDPAHMSAPCLLRNKWLLVPAEGTRRPPGDPFWKPRDPEEAAKWETNKKAYPGVMYQTIYVIDPDNLGYLGRIALPAAELPVGLGNMFSACCVDEHSGMIIATRASTLDSETPVNQVYLYRLPDLTKLPASGSQFSVTETPEIQNFYPTLMADVIGTLPLRDMDGRLLAMRDSNGVAITPGGHLFLNHRRVKKPEDPYTGEGLGEGHDDVGIHGFDLLTGRAVKYISLLDFHTDAQGLAFDVATSKLFQVFDSGWPYEGYSIATIEEVEVV